MWLLAILPLMHEKQLRNERVGQTLTETNLCMTKV